jgi:predicted Zn-dependent peptidase
MSITSLINIENSAEIKFEEFELKNGLKVILSRDDSIPSVAINLCYHVGSKNEEPGKRGYAHLFEHLMFEGSKHVPPGEYDKIVTAAGGDNNAYTTEDKTNYYLLLPAHQLELGLWLESDRMLQFAVSRESLETQKSVVIEEKKQNYDNRPYGTVGQEFAPKLFNKSGYSWDTIGDIKDIEKASLDDVRSFFDRYYVPNNTVLSIVGSIDTVNAKSQVRKYFGDISSGNNGTEYVFDENELEKEIRASVYDRVQFPGIFIGYRIPRENTRQQLAFELLSEILAGGDSSRLYNKLVYKDLLASEIGCWTDPKEFAGVFYLYAILMPGKNIGVLEKSIDSILEEISSGNISESELEKAKNKIETKQYFRKQFIVSKADLLAHYKTFYNDAGLINSYTEKYREITGVDLVESASAYLKKENRVVLHYLPVQSRS